MDDTQKKPPLTDSEQRFYKAVKEYYAGTDKKISLTEQTALHALYIELAKSGQSTPESIAAALEGMLKKQEDWRQKKIDAATDTLTESVYSYMAVVNSGADRANAVDSKLKGKLTAAQREALIKERDEVQAILDATVPQSNRNKQMFRDLADMTERFEQANVDDRAEIAVPTVSKLAKQAGLESNVKHR